LTLPVTALKRVNKLIQIQNSKYIRAYVKITMRVEITLTRE
jgi:hypothetical protein